MRAQWLIADGITLGDTGFEPYRFSTPCGCFAILLAKRLARFSNAHKACFGTLYVVSPTAFRCELKPVGDTGFEPMTYPTSRGRSTN